MRAVQSIVMSRIRLLTSCQCYIALAKKQRSAWKVCVALRPNCHVKTKAHSTPIIRTDEYNILPRKCKPT